MRWHRSDAGLISARHETEMIVMVNEGDAMITETNAVNFRQNLGEMLNQVQYRHDSVVINKDGKPYSTTGIGTSLNNTLPSYGRERGRCQGEWRDGAITQGYQQVIAALRGGACILVAQ